MTIITVNIHSDLIRRIDRIMEKGFFSSRSELIRIAVCENLFNTLEKMENHPKEPISPSNKINTIFKAQNILNINPLNTENIAYVPIGYDENKVPQYHSYHIIRK